MATPNPQQPEKVQFQWRKNLRGISEHYFTGQHLSIQRLKDREIPENPMKRDKPEDPIMKYLLKEIPPYPTPVEFRVSHVAHVTEERGFKGILASEQFSTPESEFSWWDLKINEEEIRSAEKHYMEGKLTNEAQEPNEWKPFLETFTTSPLFQPEKSRYGNYRFTFPLTDLIQWYKDQNCGGEEPVFRVYETITYKQEIVYTVLIHSPEDNKCFSVYPLLKESEWVRYQDGKIIWKAQAICETHRYHFDSGEVQRLCDHEFYVWDQVSLVFHLPIDKALKIPRKQLIQALDVCELDDIIDLSRYKRDTPEKKRSVQAKNEDCFFNAKMNVADLKRELEEEEKEKEIKEEDDMKMDKTLKSIKLKRKQHIEAPDVYNLDDNVDLSGYDGPKDKKKCFSEADEKVSELKAELKEEEEEKEVKEEQSENEENEDQ